MTDAPFDGNPSEDVNTTPAPADNGTTATVDELDVHNGEPDRPKFDDGNGVTRVAGPPAESFTPAPVDPTDEQIAANKAFHESDASAGFAPPDDAAAQLPAEPAAPVEPPAPLSEPDPAQRDQQPGDAAAVGTATPALAPQAPESDQAAVEAAAAAAADADVQAQIDADRAETAVEQAAADAAALTEAEAQEVKDEEVQI